MSFIAILVTLIIIGMLLYMANTLLPLDGKIKTILNAVVVIAVCVWLLQAFGILGPLHLGRIT